MPPPDTTCVYSAARAHSAMMLAVAGLCVLLLVAALKAVAADRRLQRRAAFAHANPARATTRGAARACL